MRALPKLNATSTGIRATVLARPACVGLLLTARKREALDDHDRASPQGRDLLAIAGAAEGRLGNQLARVVAHCERLAEDLTLPEDARERARRAMLAAFEAAETLRALIRAARDAEP